MIRLIPALALVACAGGEPTEPARPQALVLNAPARPGHPAFMLQLLAAPDLVAPLNPEVLFPPLITAIGEAFSACDLTAADAETFLFEGELRITPDGALALQTLSTNPKVTCAADAFTRAGVTGPEGLDVSLPAALVITETP